MYGGMTERHQLRNRSTLACQCLAGVDLIGQGRLKLAATLAEGRWNDSPHMRSNARRGQHLNHGSTSFIAAAVDQLADHRVCNATVVGSTPTRSYGCREGR